MEKDKRHGVLAVNKRIFVAAPLAVAMSIGSTHFLSQGHETTEITPIPQSSFKTLVLEDYNDFDKEQKLSHSNLIFTATPTPSLAPVKEVLEVKKTKGEKLLTKYKQEAKEIVAALDDAPSNKFNQRIIKDVKMYYPIYKAIADHYKIDWVSIMVTHQGESTGSRSIRAFNGGSAPYYGAGQRNRDIWPDAMVKKIYKEVFADIPEVGKIKTRHKSDASELAFVGDYINRNYDHSRKAGRTKYKALYSSFKLYSASKSLASLRVNQTKAINESINSYTP